MFLAQIPFWFFPAKMRDKNKLRQEREAVAVGSDKGDAFLGNDAKYKIPPLSSLEEQQKQQQHQPEVDTKKSLESNSSFAFYARDFLAASVRLLRNLVFVLLILGYATLMAISAGFAVFLPKFFEVTIDGLLFFSLSLFLDASSHLYMRLCPSVRMSVCPYVRMSVCPYVRNHLTRNMIPLPLPLPISRLTESIEQMNNFRSG